MPWWKAGVLYQIYPLSFADSNGDGFGDLRGIIERLDHLAWLGVDGIWLSPITVSPNADWGYDVADYCAVQPDLGTLADSTRSSRPRTQRGIRVLLDFVPNHTSDQHPWFVESRSSRDRAGRDWYVWADPQARRLAAEQLGEQLRRSGVDARRRRPASTTCTTTCVEQPDLNWWNDEVRDEFDDILRFWFDRGIAGFRIDVCNLIIKDAELRDNPPATADDPLGRAAVRPARGVQRQPARGARRHPPLAHASPTPTTRRACCSARRRSTTSTTLGAFYGADLDELHLAFNFPFINAPFEADGDAARSSRRPKRCSRRARGRRGRARTTTCRGSRPAGPHDDPRQVRAALLMLLGLRGTPVLYQGDEIGLGDVAVEPPDLRDPLGVRYWPAYAGRDAMRTPMHWRDAPGGGFTDPDVTPWLPLGDTDGATSRASATIRTRCSRSPATSSRCAGRPPICAPVRTARCPRRTGCGPGGAVSGTRSWSTAPRMTSTSNRSPAACESAPIAVATARRSPARSGSAGGKAWSAELGS